eukprot:CAMPEP_0174258170 /NCGR_PEP_ID=MMETSP0439-20130205/7220_1 /TAXON_ID=0 /ORGANISM="Stereomyxa ramosa, Strain Chinc5" /LENGTH=85 /DNA_ID=CAMNT_0015341583 /DNA_START=21 /DNA_END=274 /DNA_ORIENTATION=+
MNQVVDSNLQFFLSEKEKQKTPFLNLFPENTEQNGILGGSDDNEDDSLWIQLLEEEDEQHQQHQQEEQEKEEQEERLIRSKELRG